MNDYTSANKKNIYNSEIYSLQDRIDSDIESLEITMIQIRQLINVLNSEFFNSTDSLYGPSQVSIKLYYELFQSIAKGLKPVEISIQNPNLLINGSNKKFEKLYFKFMTDFIELLLAINLPKEVFNPICNFFSPLLVIFMRNLIDEKTIISQEDFTLIAQLNQGSFAVFESILKSLFSNCFYKLDLINEIIHDADEKGENKILTDSFEELKKSLIWTKEYANQSNTILNSIFAIRCEIISYKVNKVKLSSLLNEIETAAKKCILYDNANKSLNEFLKFLNTDNQNIKISSYFVNCGQLQTFYEKVNKLQLLEIENLLNEDLISNEFAEEMKKILENIFDYKENTMLDKVISLVDEQLYNYHHQNHEENQEEDQSIKLKKNKKEEFDLDLQKMIPPSYYDQTIALFLDYIRNPEISGDIPLTLKKDMMTLQLTEIITAFKKDKLNQPTKNTLNGLVNDLSFLLSKATSINAIDCTIHNRKFSLFLSIYIATIKIFLIARENYKDSEEDFQQIYKVFCELIPPPSFILKMVNLNERFQSLQQASKYLMEIAASTSELNSEEGNSNEEDDRQLNNEKVNIYGSRDALSKLVFELDIASVVLSFIEKNKEFCELIECTEFSTDLWNEDQCDESGENFIEENSINASLSLFSLFNTEGFYFDISPSFFINWITFNFSTFNKNIQSIPLNEFVPFCNYSEISGAIINSCTLIGLYARVNIQENAKNLISIVESIKLTMLLVFTHHKLDEVLLTNQIQTCIKEARAYPSLFNKINALCHTILTKICCYIKIFEFMKYVRILNSNKVCYVMPIETINYSIEILKKLKMISQSKILPPEFLETIDDVSSKLASIVDNHESNPLPFFFSQDMDQAATKVYSILNEIRKVINKFDMTTIVSQVSTYIDEILTYYETKQGESSEDKFTFSSEAFDTILKLKNQVDELAFANKNVYAEIAIIKIQLIIERAEFIFPKLDKPLDELREMINICYAIFSIKTMLNFAYFIMSQYTKSGIVLENWYKGEFDENFIFCKEDENIDYQYTYIMDYINSVVCGMEELQNRINSFATETELEQASSNNKNSNQQLFLLKNKIVKEIDSSFQTLSSKLKAKLENLNNRKISPEIVQLEKECEELIQQFASYPNQSQNLPNTYQKINLKMLPSSSKLIIQFESESLQLALKNISIKEMEKKIEILQEELNKRQNQINQSIDSSVVDSRKKQRERSHQIIQLIKKSIVNLNNPNSNNEKVNEVDNSGEISADDPNYQIIQKLKKQLSNLNEENLKLKNEIREIEFHHKASREDQIDLLMDKSCNFSNPSISTVRNEKSSGISEKNSELLSKQARELNRSIEKMRNKIQTDKKQGSNETVMIKLLKDIRPHAYSDALLSEEALKQVAKSTQDVAEKVMKEWKALRAELESAT